MKYAHPMTYVHVCMSVVAHGPKRRRGPTHGRLTHARTRRDHLVLQVNLSSMPSILTRSTSTIESLGPCHGSRTTLDTHPRITLTHRLRILSPQDQLSLVRPPRPPGAAAHALLPADRPDAVRLIDTDRATPRPANRSSAACAQNTRTPFDTTGRNCAIHKGSRPPCDLVDDPVARKTPALHFCKCVACGCA